MMTSTQRKLLLAALLAATTAVMKEETTLASGECCPAAQFACEEFCSLNGGGGVMSCGMDYVSMPLVSVECQCDNLSVYDSSYYVC
jgi:hypothetical protein